MSVARRTPRDRAFSARTFARGPSRSKMRRTELRSLPPKPTKCEIPGNLTDWRWTKRRPIPPEEAQARTAALSALNIGRLGYSLNVHRNLGVAPC